MDSHQATTEGRAALRAIGRLQQVLRSKTPKKHELVRAAAQVADSSARFTPCMTDAVVGHLRDCVAVDDLQPAFALGNSPHEKLFTLAGHLAGLAEDLLLNLAPDEWQHLEAVRSGLGAQNAALIQPESPTSTDLDALIEEMRSIVKDIQVDVWSERVEQAHQYAAANRTEHATDHERAPEWHRTGLTVTDAAKLLGWDKGRVTKECDKGAQGALRSHGRGRMRRIDPESVKAIKSGQRDHAAAPKTASEVSHAKRAVRRRRGK